MVAMTEGIGGEAKLDRLVVLLTPSGLVVLLKTIGNHTGLVKVLTILGGGAGVKTLALCIGGYDGLYNLTKALSYVHRGFASLITASGGSDGLAAMITSVKCLEDSPVSSKLKLVQVDCTV